MSVRIISGKDAAFFIKNSVKQEIENSDSDISINLVVIQVGNDTASQTYIRNKQRACEYVGINVTTHYFENDVSQKTLEDFICNLNNDDSVNGIFVQLPLPMHLEVQNIIEKIAPEKDVDGFTFINAGKLARDSYYHDYMVPCTPMGIMKLLQHHCIDVFGKHCVIVGRSNIVGKPMAELLLNNNATVTVCNSYTNNLKDICKTADILVCATGTPKMFDSGYIKDGAVVIDVGMNRDENGKLCGDVDFDDVNMNCDNVLLTPVPGGVGPMTVASLMLNCMNAYKIQNKDNM